MSTTRNIAKRALGTVAVVGLVAGATLAAPQGDGIGFGGHPAMAAPGGNGNGNGNGGANGNGGNSGDAGGNSGNAGANGSAGGQASGDSNGSPGQGHAFGRSQSDDGAHASDLGRLNAAHASETARENAAATSAVGQVASYEGNVTGGDLEAAAADLAEAANKEIVEPVVHAVNELLGIDDAPVGGDEDQAMDGDADGDSGSDTDGDSGVTVHDTEPEVTARANGTFESAGDGDTDAPEGARDS